MVDTNDVVTTKQEADLQQKYAAAQEALDFARKQYDSIVHQMAKVHLDVTEPTDFARKTAAKQGPMDDAFFNLLAEDSKAVEEIIRTVLGIPVKVRSVIPQYVISHLGVRGVRLDVAASIEPRVIVTAELEDDCFLGQKGALVDIEVQKDDKKDSEYRVFFNGASLILDNTPRGISNYNEIPPAVIIFISAYDVFEKGRMYYETCLTEKYTGINVKRPVTEIYINTKNIDQADRTDTRMSNIAEMLKVFRDNDYYDTKLFPEFSRAKRELRETERGVLKLSKEIQAEINRVAAEQTQEQLREKERDIREVFGKLLSDGRIEDAKRASEDSSYFHAVAAEYRTALNYAV